MNTHHCVLAYSGGLDTSAIVPWLLEHGLTVHALAVDVGQSEDFDAVCARALELGADSATVADVKQTICAQVLPYVIGLGATYEGHYRLGTALTRPFIAQAQVQLAQQLGGATLVHGATGKGNDQVRFEFAYKSLAPNCQILAPWKQWAFAGRQDLIDYLKSKNIDIAAESTPAYSMDENLWHLSVEGGVLEDPCAQLDVHDVLNDVRGRFAGGHQSVQPQQQLTIEFVAGVPVALDGLAMPLIDVVFQLNRWYRDASWAWDLVIENRFTGVKSRGLYINPAAKVLNLAIDALARNNLNKPLFDWYTKLGHAYGAMLYRGEYFSPQRLPLEAAAGSIMQRLTGRVTVDLRTQPYVSAIRSEQAVFSEALATFEQSDFSHRDANGFIQLSWLGNVGISQAECTYADPVEEDHGATSGVQTHQQVSDDGLVVPAV